MAKDKAEGKKRGILEKITKWLCNHMLATSLVAGLIGAVIEVEREILSMWTPFNNETISKVMQYFWKDGRWMWALALAFAYSIWTIAIACLIEGFKENTSQNKHNIKLNFLHRKDEGITSVEYEGDLVTLIIKDDGLSVVTKGTEQQVFDGEVNISPSDVPV